VSISVTEQAIFNFRQVLKEKLLVAGVTFWGKNHIILHILVCFDDVTMVITSPKSGENRFSEKFQSSKLNVLKM